MEQFARIQRLPPYVFAVVVELKSKLRHAGEDIIDLGMGNPDLPTPKHIVDKLVEAARNPRNHRYSLSRGIPKLRLAICNWYKRKYNVDLDPETESIATIGAKEGLSHLVLATMGPGDIALVPNPTYPIHNFSVIIAGADVRSISLTSGEGDFVERAERAIKTMWPRPKMMILSFPHNPTTQVVDLDFFKRVVAFAKEHKLLVIHDLAYADLVFDGYKAPSILQVHGAKDVAVELYSMSKGYSMPGWRVGFVVGNKRMVGALTRRFDDVTIDDVQKAGDDGRRYVRLRDASDCQVRAVVLGNVKKSLQPGQKMAHIRALVHVSSNGEYEVIVELDQHIAFSAS